MDIPRDKDYFEEYLDRFPNSPSLVLVRSVELKNFPQKFIAPPVLDLCCGDGLFAEILGLTDAYGCDIDEYALNKAKERASVYKDVKLCDARNLNEFRSNFFNTVISNCALEHVDGIEDALKSVSRVLKDKGKLIMTVPSKNLDRWFPGSNEKLLRHSSRQMHINVFSLEEWKEMLEKSNFKIIESYYLFNETSYKTAIFWDALPELLGPFFKLYYWATKFMPKQFKKLIFRYFLKQYYIESIPLYENGGELVIIAECIKNDAE